MFENETNSRLNYFKNQIKFKNSFRILLNYVKFQLLSFFQLFPQKSDFA